MILRQICHSAWLMVLLVASANTKAVDSNIDITETPEVFGEKVEPIDLGEDSEQDTENTAWKIDGIDFSDIPEKLRLAAYMKEFYPLILQCHAKENRVRDIPSLCQTSECSDLMKQYEDWREKNGMGLASGRWG